MPLRSMTGFAQVKGQVNAQLAFALSLKSVNHRFLDLHFRLPSDTDALEMKLRRMLKEKMARGHVEVILNLGSFRPQRSCHQPAVDRRIRRSLSRGC